MWLACLSDNKILKDHRFLQRNISQHQTIQFEKLDYAKNYTACVAASVDETLNPCNNRGRFKFICKNIQTTCEDLPVAKKQPSQVEWNISEDFNPFKQIKIKMEIGTFEGAKSGLRTFDIR